MNITMNPIMNVALNIVMHLQARSHGCTSRGRHAVLRQGVCPVKPHQEALYSKLPLSALSKHSIVKRDQIYGLEQLRELASPLLVVDNRYQ